MCVVHVWSIIVLYWMVSAVSVLCLIWLSSDLHKWLDCAPGSWWLKISELYFQDEVRIRVVGTYRMIEDGKALNISKSTPFGYRSEECVCYNCCSLYEKLLNLIYKFKRLIKIILGWWWQLLMCLVSLVRINQIWSWWPWCWPEASLQNMITIMMTSAAISRVSSPADQCRGMLDRLHSPQLCWLILNSDPSTWSSPDHLTLAHILHCSRSLAMVINIWVL